MVCEQRLGKAQRLVGHASRLEPCGAHRPHAVDDARIDRRITAICCRVVALERFERSRERLLRLRRAHPRSERAAHQNRDALADERPDLRDFERRKVERRERRVRRSSDIRRGVDQRPVEINEDSAFHSARCAIARGCASHGQSRSKRLPFRNTLTQCAAPGSGSSRSTAAS
jgi:hypothetical protein